MKTFYGDLKLGILGGGQLGRMLIQQAINYNVTVKVLDPDREAPCRKLCDEFVVGSLGDYETVYNFGKKVDLLTIEIEKVNVEALEQLAPQLERLATLAERSKAYLNLGEQAGALFSMEVQIDSAAGSPSHVAG